MVSGVGCTERNQLGNGIAENQKSSGENSHVWYWQATETRKGVFIKFSRVSEVRDGTKVLRLSLIHISSFGLPKFPNSVHTSILFLNFRNDIHSNLVVSPHNCFLPLFVVVNQSFSMPPAVEFRNLNTSSILCSPTIFLACTSLQKAQNDKKKFLSNIRSAS